MSYAFDEQYQSALMEYLDRQGEGALERAYELGRQAIASELGILELATVHQQALEVILARVLALEHRALLAMAAEFFLQSLSPFEIVHRGMKETNLTLRRLHRTLEQHIIEEQRLHQELGFARQVQESLLPAASPRVPGLRFYQYYQPAREVGGDYFDYVHLPGRRLAVAVGDVAGKGVPAALLMARVSTEERYCLLTERTASEALTRLNQELTPSIGDRFVTCAFLILDLESYQVTVVNAGHLPPLLRRGGSPIVEHVGTETAGLPLGVAPEVPYVQTEFSLQQGDVLALFTDGLTEAENLSGELYRLQRLAAVFSCGPGQVDAIADTVLKDVKRFTSGTSLRDDVTLICFGREG